MASAQDYLMAGLARTNCNAIIEVCCNEGVEMMGTRGIARLVVILGILLVTVPYGSAQDGDLALRARKAKALAAATSPERIRRLQRQVQKALDANDVRVTPALPLTMRAQDGHKMEVAVTIPAVHHPGEQSAFNAIKLLTKIEPDVAKESGGIMPDVADPMSAKEAIDDVALIRGDSGELPSEKQTRVVMEAAYE